MSIVFVLRYRRRDWLRLRRVDQINETLEPLCHVRRLHTCETQHMFTTNSDFVSTHFCPSHRPFFIECTEALDLSLYFQGLRTKMAEFSEFYALSDSYLLAARLGR